MKVPGTRWKLKLHGFTGRTGSVRGSSHQSMSLRLLLKHQLTAGLDAVVLLRRGDVAHRAGSPRQGSVPVRLRLFWAGHTQEAGQPLKEKLDAENRKQQQSEFFSTPRFIHTKDRVSE